MAQVLIPQRQTRVTSGASREGAALGRILPIAGAVIGGAVGGGPAGAMAGNAAGQAATSMFGLERRTDTVATGSGGVNETESAASRRMTKIQQDPYTALAQANVALDRAPKEIQDAYRKPLEEAMTIAQKSRHQSAIAQRGGIA